MLFKKLSGLSNPVRYDLDMQSFNCLNYSLQKFYEISIVISNKPICFSTNPTMNSISKPSTIENNPRNYQIFEYPTSNNSILDFPSQNSVDPSVRYNTQQSFGYVDRDYGFEFEMRTRIIEELRTKLLEQQIANNRKLIDSICSRGYSSTLKEFYTSAENITYSVHDDR